MSTVQKRRRRVGALVAVALAVAGPSHAFKPDDSGHLGVTEEAIRGIDHPDVQANTGCSRPSSPPQPIGPITRVVDGATYEFSDRAVREIRAANKDSDCKRCQLDATIHFDDEELTDSNDGLIEGAARIVGEITGPRPDGQRARELLGRALHTAQDFYSHSSWVELRTQAGDLAINLDLGASDGLDGPIGEPVCSDPATLLPDAPLTTGFFKFVRGLCGVADGKCRHGVSRADSFGLLDCPGGLHKDTFERTGHCDARGLALVSSRRFIDQILDDPAVEGNAEAVGALMDAGGPGFGVAIDHTGSMSEELPVLKRRIREAVADRVASPDTTPQQWVLVRLEGSPSTPEVFGRGEHEAFLAAVESIEAGGGGSGGGCPVAIFSSYWAAIDALRPGSTLWGFTDASPSDPEVAPAVAAAAKSKGIAVSHMLTGVCEELVARAALPEIPTDWIDPSFADVSYATGGVSLPLYSTDLDRALDLVYFDAPVVGQEIQTLRAIADATAFERPLPVDSTIERLTVLLTPEANVEVAPDRFDHFAFTTTATEDVRIEIWAERIGSPLDAVLRVFDASGAQLAANDDQIGRDPRIDFAAPGAGTYVVRVESAVRSAVVGQRYKLGIGAVGDASILEAEPNDSAEQAQPVELGSRVAGVLERPSLDDLRVELVDPSGFAVPLSDQDRDVVSFDGLAGDLLQAEVRAARDGASTDAVLRLIAPDGVTVLAQNDDRYGLDPGLELTLPATGAYSIEVSDARRRTSEPGAYTFLVRRNGVAAAAPIAELEPNDTPASSVPLTFPGEMNGSIAVRGVRFADGTRFESIDAPKPGAWSLRVSAPAAIPYRSTVRGVSPIVATEAAVVELAGRPAHQGLFDIAGEPVAGAPALFLAGLTGPVASMEFSLVGGDELELLEPANPSGDDALVGGEEHALESVIPHEPFRVLVSGSDLSGHAFQRLYAGTFRPQDFAVSVLDEGLSIRRGTARTVDVVVHNYGPDGSFTLEAIANLGAVAVLPDTPVEIASGQEAIFAITFSVPSDADLDSILNVMLQATRMEDPDAANAARIGLDLRDSNDRPIAFDARYTAAEPDPIEISLQAEDGDGDPLSFSIVQGPALGELLGDGATLVYSHRPEARGTDTIRFVASDDEGASEPATITIELVPEPAASAAVAAAFAALGFVARRRARLGREPLTA